MTRKKRTPRRQRSQKQASKSRTSEKYSYIVDLWVKEPPSHSFPFEELQTLPSPYTTEMDQELPFETRMLLMTRRRQFERTHNSIFAIEAFLIARSGKLFPPMWILDWLEKGFRDFHEAQGTRSLEKILGLMPKRGQSPFFKALLEEERDEMLCLDVFRLTNLFNISIDDAAHMVASRLEATPHWNNSKYQLHSISEETIADRYKRKWKKIFDTEGIRERLIGLWTKTQVDKYLQSFPQHSYENLNLRSSLTR